MGTGRRSTIGNADRCSVVTSRLKCCVPFCRHTTGRTEFSEWLCGDHWRLIDLENRRVYGRYAKRWRRYRNIEDGAAADRMWNWLKRKAIERAVGITA